MLKPTLTSIVRYLNRELRVREIPDSSRNGLQVRARKKTVAKVGFAVDAAGSTFEKAKRAGVDLIVVHHGLLWKGQRDATGLKKQRIAYLKRNGMSLYAAHLPLDLHPIHGNNIQLAHLLHLEDVRTFGRYHGVTIGFQGELPRARTAKELARSLARSIKARCVVLNGGAKRIRTMGIVSGGGAFALAEAARLSLNCLLIGEGPHHLAHEASELKCTVIVAGHYQTETVGVRALMPIISERFGVKTVFIDNPTVL